MERYKEDILLELNEKLSDCVSLLKEIIDDDLISEIEEKECGALNDKILDVKELFEEIYNQAKDGWE